MGLRRLEILTQPGSKIGDPSYAQLPTSNVALLEGYGQLSPELKDPKRPQELLKPYPAWLMEAYPVSSRVNSPRNNDSGLLAEV